MKLLSGFSESQSAEALLLRYRQADPRGKAQLRLDAAHCRNELRYAGISAMALLRELDALNALCDRSASLPSSSEVIRYAANRQEVNDHLLRFLEPFLSLSASYPRLIMDTSFCVFDRAKLVSLCRQAIEHRYPFSYVRLGDGEGAFLCPEARDSKDQSRLFNRWFGRACQASDAERFEAILIDCIANADVIGVPAAQRLVADFEVTPAHKSARLIQVYDGLNNAFSKDGWHYPWVTSAFSHIDLWKTSDWAVALRGLLSVNVISGHKEHLLRDKLIAHMGVYVDVYIKISPAFEFEKTFGAGEECRHYPDQFDQICADLATSDLAGKVYLVGAGFLGKYYCSLIKERGGVALDLGSVFDYLMGFKTRRHAL